MKALIFNSGIGKRMGELTKNSPKSMVKLSNGETVFERQIRLLSENGIKEFIITTGPFEEQLIQVTKKAAYEGLSFQFIHNEIYDKTNYIYSCYLAREFLHDDLLTLHGDLVFDSKLVSYILNHPNKSLGLMNQKIPLPEKDFKCRVIEGKIREVGINIFDENCFTFQPFYKLSKQDAQIWLNAIIDFIENKYIDQVYAENAFNTVSEEMNVVAVSYEGYFINEIDNVDDYHSVTDSIKFIDYRLQQIVNSFDEVEKFIRRFKIKHPMVVIDSFLANSWVAKELKGYTDPVFYDKFNPNPDYIDIVKAVEVFKAYSCDALISVGGGSALDTAKAVKMFLPLNAEENYLSQDPVYVNLKHIAVPTTAGTGSESTRYSVIYFNGEKKSLTQDFLIPEVAVLEKKFLTTLPLNQKKATTFDALCHAIESIWSVNSTNESEQYASEAIKMILNNIDDYFCGNENSYDNMLKAANLAGKAINISQTTAAHALSYKLTTLYHIPHGQAVALCLPGVWECLIKKCNNTIGPNDRKLISAIDLLNELFNGNALEKFCELIRKYQLAVKLDVKNDLSLLVDSVNVTRLKNFPLQLTKDEIKSIYLNLSL